jgi:uncharacterized protein YaeQ
VIDIDGESVEALAGMIERSMRLNVLIQDGELQLMGDTATVALRAVTRMAPSVQAA